MSKTHCNQSEISSHVINVILSTFVYHINNKTFLRKKQGKMRFIWYFREKENTRCAQIKG